MSPARNRYATEIPEPPGAEWLPVDGGKLWLPRQDREQLGNLPPEWALVLTGPGWAMARSALDFILEHSPRIKAKYRIEWASRIGRGLSKETYHVDITLSDRKKDAAFSVGLIHGSADPDAGTRMIAEQSLLERIAGCTSHFSVPEPVGMVWSNGSLAAVTSYLPGFPVEYRASRSPRLRPWEVVGQVAAEIHSLPTHGLPENITRHPTRQDHALAAASRFKQLAVPEIQDALQWISENLPRAQDSVLLHSDLLGQNVLQTLECELSVIDWEYAFVGDPAYDLAIVTGGARKPFQASGGLDRLVEAYLSAGGQKLSKKEVQIHEVLFCLGWYEQSLDRSEGGPGPDQYLNQLRGILKRAAK